MSLLVVANSATRVVRLGEIRVKPTLIALTLKPGGVSQKVTNPGEPQLAITQHYLRWTHIAQRLTLCQTSTLEEKWYTID